MSAGSWPPLERAPFQQQRPLLAARAGAGPQERQPQQPRTAVGVAQRSWLAVAGGHGDEHAVSGRCQGQDTRLAACCGDLPWALARTVQTPRYSAPASYVGRGLPAGPARAGDIAHAARRTPETCLRRETSNADAIPHHPDFRAGARHRRRAGLRPGPRVRLPAARKQRQGPRPRQWPAPPSPRAMPRWWPTTRPRCRPSTRPLQADVTVIDLTAEFEAAAAPRPVRRSRSRSPAATAAIRAA